METLIIVLIVVGAFLWWTDSWPFDGSYNLPRRNRGPQQRPNPPPSSGNPPST